MDAIERLQQHYVTSHDDVMRRIAQLIRQTCATQSSSSDAEVKATDNIVEVVQEEERRPRKVTNNVFPKTATGTPPSLLVIYMMKSAQELYLELMRNVL